MNLNSTPSAERIHIGIFGKRNAGKSSLINKITGQDLAIVSPVEGTTTDPVQKAMELLPLGPVVLIDTPGIDDAGELGSLRVRKSYQMLNKCNLAIVVSNICEEFSVEDQNLLNRIRKKKIPCMIVFSQSDRVSKEEEEKKLQRMEIQFQKQMGEEIPVLLAASAVTGYGIQKIKEKLGSMMLQEENEKKLVRDLLIPGKFTVLVVPIDKAAPKGRLILPQQQTIRDILEGGGATVVVRESELAEILCRMEGQIGLVVTDSQVFEQVGKIVPEEIPLTSFSILFARYKGELEPLIAGVRAVKELKDGDHILICEGCTHHRQCNDIGTVKIPGWLQKETGKTLQFSFVSGGEFPQDLSPYRLVIHCGGCMLNAREMKYRIACGEDAGVPVTNYGILISYLKGILERSIEPVR
ncbi:MAG: [FeFe] hydrogenase H-cluster maturation GTPase HydF [Oliverpabstia sp.]|nr:[FeFe] hydrogenase H-cluster maturation GTPase HydF [Oliverpabstia sp.]